jgi:hypothetical protein
VGSGTKWYEAYTKFQGKMQIYYEAESLFLLQSKRNMQKNDK